MSLLLAAGAELGPALAQQYVISTYAGGGPPPARAQAMDAWIGFVLGIATDTAGNVYFSSSEFSSIFKLDPNGVLTRVAGNGRAGYSGDGGPAAAAQLNDPRGVVVDGLGNLFIADYRNSRIRRVSPDGIIATVAGDGSCCFAGDGGAAASAQLSYPDGVAVDSGGNLLIVGGDRVRKVSPAGIITTVAGDGVRGFSGDSGPAAGAQLNGAIAVAADQAGNLFIGELGRIRRVSPRGIITTVAGVGTYGGSGDGGPATSAQLTEPRGLGVDGAGNLLIADPYSHRVRKVSADGIISTVAGSGWEGSSGDKGPAVEAVLAAPTGIAVDSAGNLFITDRGRQRVRKVSTNGVIATVAEGLCCFWGDGGTATSARLNSPMGVAVDGAGNVFIADTGNQRVRRVSPDGIITTVAGDGTRGFSGDDGPATSAALTFPFGVAVDSESNLFIADFGNRRVRRVSPDGIITTVAGNGAPDFSGDGGPATSAALSAFGVAVDSQGSLFIADGRNHRVRKVSPDGRITTVAGNGMPGPSGDGGPATGAALSPRSVAVDAAGNLFIADAGNDQLPLSYDTTNDRLSRADNGIRRVSTDGIITTVAGGGTAHWGDGGPATSSEIRFPNGVAVDGAGNLFLATSGFNLEIVGPDRVRKVSPSGIITTVAGAGTAFPGDGGPASDAALSGPSGMAVDGAGNIYVTEYTGAVRILRPTSFLIGEVVDAASQRARSVSPGKTVSIYGVGGGPSEFVQSRPRDQSFTELTGTTVSFNGTAAPILYASATHIAALPHMPSVAPQPRRSLLRHLFKAGPRNPELPPATP
jgi:sugar lactone lactonase YvrE